MNDLLKKIIKNKSLMQNTDRSIKTSIKNCFVEILYKLYLEFLDLEVKFTSYNYAAERLFVNLKTLFLHGLKNTFIN